MKRPMTVAALLIAGGIALTGCSAAAAPEPVPTAAGVTQDAWDACVLENPANLAYRDALEEWYAWLEENPAPDADSAQAGQDGFVASYLDSYCEEKLGGAP